MNRFLRALGLGRYRHFKGTDLRGNEYFERPDPNQPHYMRRTIVPAGMGPRAGSYYVASDVPALCSAWMRRTRDDFPTLEELHADVQRQLDLSDNVARLQEEYKAEKIRLAAQNAASTQALATMADPKSAMGPQETLLREGREASSELQRARKHFMRSPLEDYRPAAMGGSDSDQPQSWQPTLATRR